MTDLTPYEILARTPDPSRPWVTHYAGPDVRVELSVTSMANAVAKAAGFLGDELGLGPGATFSVDLPRHWQLPVWVLGALSTGTACGRRVVGPVDARIIGPQAVPGPADQVLVSACDAFGMPVPGGVPPGQVDVAAEVRAQPDSLHVDPDAARNASLDLGTGPLPWPDVLRGVGTAHPDLPHGARLWVDEGTPEADLLARACVLPLVLGGSVVLASGLTAQQAARIRSLEAATADPPR